VNAPTTGSTGAAAAKRHRRRLALIAAVAAPVVLGGCQLPTFQGYRGSTHQGHDEFLLYAGTFIAAIVVGVLTAALIIWSIVRYRRRSDDAIPRQFQYHTGLEVAYTVIPVIIVLILFGFTVWTENNVDDVAAHPAQIIDVNAFQWGWQFNYYQQHVSVEGETLNDPDPVGPNNAICAPAVDCRGPGLVVPAGETVRIDLRSLDTIHGFYVPAFNFSRYAQPGVLNTFDLTVQNVGVYRAQCTQFCGLYHSEMFFHVVALPPAQFQAWLSTERSATTAAARTPSSGGTGSAGTGSTAAVGHTSTSTREAAA
jgi:cytochrome c oxidase subunit 2